MLLFDSDIEMRLHELTCTILRHAPEDGVYETAIPGLRLRHTTQITQPVHSVASPSLYIIFRSFALSLYHRAGLQNGNIS